VGRVRGNRLRGVHITKSNIMLAWTLGGALTMYDLKTLKPIRSLAGGRGYIVNMQSDTRGALLAAGGGDRRVTLYDLVTGGAIGEPINVPDDETTEIALRPDGRELAVGGSETVGMQIWDLDPQHWITAACQVAGRNLTRAEWEDNIGSLLDYRATCEGFPAAS
ncbi:MAG TPA: WD40 repeat domain-containing protein, partial [Acidimicrobiia bacterium]|nr:WD40 repeat domain-containing protein [Acidimicrobiia bacterium]